MNERHWLLERASQAPQAPALEQDGVALSYAGLADRARRGAAWIMATAPAGQAPLGLLLPGGMDFACWFHAVGLAGRAVLPLNARLTAAEVARQLADSRTKWLLATAGDARLEALAEAVLGLHVHTPPGLDTLPAAAGPLPGEVIAPDATLAVLFTSGTSGRARGARLSWGNFEASARASAARLGPAAAGRWLACMPLFHVGGLSLLTRSVILGGPVRLLPRFDPAAVSDALEAGDVAGVSLVPTMLSRLLEARGDRPPPAGLAVVLLGGAAAPQALLARALDSGWPVCPTYGLTETTSQVATVAPGDRHSALHARLPPLPGVELRIVTERGDAAPGEEGEIAVRGPVVMSGYLNEPEATARALRDGWLFTGDVGRLDEAGRLTVLDRRGDLIVSGGENVYPAEVEAVLLAHPDVADAGVSGLADEDLGARVVAWVVLRAAMAADAGALQRHCRTQLAGYKLPREIRFVDALPRNAAGKLERRRLADSSG